MKLVVLALAVGVSVLLAAPAPSYDPWMWLLWGRELARLRARPPRARRSSRCPWPSARCCAARRRAPVAWVLLARAGARSRSGSAFRPGRGWPVGRGRCRRGGRGVVRRLPRLRGRGARDRLDDRVRPGGVLAWRQDRRARALAFGVACALLRVEAWPFLLVAGACCGGDARRTAVLLACAVRRPGGVVRPGVARFGRPAALGRARAGPQPRASPRPRPCRRGPRCARGRDCRCGRCGSAPRGACRPRGARAAARCRRRSPGSARRRDGSGRVLRRARYSLPGAALLAIAGAAALMLARARARLPLASPLLGSPRRSRNSRGSTSCTREQAWQWSLAQDLERAIDGRRRPTRCWPADARTSGPCAALCSATSSTSRSAWSPSSRSPRRGLPLEAPRGFAP